MLGSRHISDRVTSCAPVSYHFRVFCPCAHFVPLHIAHCSPMFHYLLPIICLPDCYVSRPYSPAFFCLPVLGTDPVYIPWFLVWIFFYLTLTFWSVLYCLLFGLPSCVWPIASSTRCLHICIVADCRYLTLAVLTTNCSIKTPALPRTGSDRQLAII